MPQKKHDHNPAARQDVRSQAEQRLKQKYLDSGLPALSTQDSALSTLLPEEALRTIHELQVFHIELEMQQEELVQSREALARSKAELEESVNRYAELYEFAPIGYLTLARDTSILQINLTATTMFGVERSLLKGHRFITFLSDEDRPVIETMMETLYSNREKQSHEATLLPGFSGHTVRIDAVLGDNGTECRVILIDITERKKATEAALKLVEDRHRYLFEHMLNGIAYCKILLHDGRPADFIYEQVNARFETLTGLKNVEGKKVSELIPGIDELHPELLEIYGRVATGGQPERFEFYLEPLKIWFDIAAYSLEKDHFVAIFDNITERKLADIALKKLSVAIEQSPAIVVMTDPLGNIEYVNPAFTQVTGYSAEEAKGQNPRILKSGNMPQAVYEDLWKTILSGQIWYGELHNKKKNGDLYWDQAAISAIRNNENVITSFVAVKVDITEQKRIVQELLVAKQKAEESDRLKSAFLATITHELRTPLNGILGFAELLTEPELPQEESAEYVDLIHQSGQRLLMLINELIDIARIESGETRVQQVITNVNKLLRDLTTFFKLAISKKGLRLKCTTELPDSESIIQTDSAKLTQILSNLVNNALKFTFTGCIEIGYTMLNGTLEFYVNDTGIGIPSTMQDKIFDRFIQVDNPLTRGMEGSGLGLSITKSYIEMLGGTIHVHSVEGKGSSFTFTLPYNPPATSEPAKVAPSLLLLIAEDDDINRILLKKILKEENMTILYAHNGQEAVELAKLHPEINLVLMDIKMPLLNSYEATREIKKLRSDLPIIAQTAYTAPEDREKAIEAGCDRFIKKPISKKELLALMHELLYR